jgi:hypothetical protein
MCGFGLAGASGNLEAPGITRALVTMGCGERGWDVNRPDVVLEQP